MLIGAFILYTGCSSEDKTDYAPYIEEILQWRKDRVKRLIGPTSWVSLAGRFPVPKGTSSFGTHDTCTIHFPGKGPDHLGTLIADAARLEMHAAHGVTHLLDDGSPFGGGIIDMTNPPMFHVDALYWTFIERSGEYFLRLWDTLSPARNALHEIPAYPVDPAWNIPVKFTPADSGATIMLDDIQGLRRPNELIGSISGSWRDTAFTLLALDGGEKELFIIIEDATTDIETYPGGRYLYIPRADSTGQTTIDFNKAYNPPCAFTEFATCLLPPEENRLPFAVRAGEKEYHHK
jgi:uncharacterized protein (DUF1684 family)